MFEEMKRKLQRAIDWNASVIKEIDDAEDFVEAQAIAANRIIDAGYTGEEYIVHLVTAAMEFNEVTGSDLAAVVNDGLEHWRKQEKGTYTPVIDPAEYVDAREDEAEHE